MHTIGLIIATTVDVEYEHSNVIDTILIKVASRCNINCTYCYVYNMGDDNWSKLSKFLSNETIEGICVSLNEIKQNQTQPFSIVLHGGEPFLLGKIRLVALLEKIRKVLPESYPISIQTNGVLISDELLDICSFYKVTVAISIDGPKQIHDRYRVSHSGKGTFDEVMKGLTILRNHRDSEFLNIGLLAVIDPDSDPNEVYTFFKSIDASSLDFLYKDGNLDNLPVGKSSLDSTEYGRWMLDLLEIYLDDPNPISIRVLDDIMKVVLGGIVSKEGLGVTDYGILIIDTDGTVMKNDTLKSSFNGADKFLKPINIANDQIIEFLKTKEFTDYRKLQKPTNEKCLNCELLSICGGGMILHRYSKYNGYNNPSVYCSDQKLLIEGIKKTLSKFLINQ
ncbi:MAG: cyclophane-forming radical SAM/SPASM peptide maturase YhhB [Fluviicola sp.]